MNKRQVILNIATSLDGFIAKSDGNVDWLNSTEYDLPDEDYGLNSFSKSVDTTLMGNSTYKQVLGFDCPFPYPDTTNFVFSRSQEKKDTEHVKFVSGDVVEFVRQLVKQEGKDIWLIGGGQINSILIENGLVDRIILTLIPITLGEGIPLFDGKPRDTRFELENTLAFSSGLVQLTLKTRK